MYIVLLSCALTFAHNAQKLQLVNSSFTLALWPADSPLLFVSEATVTLTSSISLDPFLEICNQSSFLECQGCSSGGSIFIKNKKRELMNECDLLSSHVRATYSLSNRVERFLATIGAFLLGTLSSFVSFALASHTQSEITSSNSLVWNQADIDKLNQNLFTLQSSISSLQKTTIGLKEFVSLNSFYDENINRIYSINKAIESGRSDLYVPHHLFSETHLSRAFSQLTRVASNLGFQLPISSASELARCHSFASLSGSSLTFHLPIPLIQPRPLQVFTPHSVPHLVRHLPLPLASPQPGPFFLRPSLPPLFLFRSVGSFYSGSLDSDCVEINSKLVCNSLLLQTPSPCLSSLLKQDISSSLSSCNFEFENLKEFMVSRVGNRLFFLSVPANVVTMSCPGGTISRYILPANSTSSLLLPPGCRAKNPFFDFVFSKKLSLHVDTAFSLSFSLPLPPQNGSPPVQAISSITLTPELHFAHMSWSIFLLLLIFAFILIRFCLVRRAQQRFAAASSSSSPSSPSPIPSFADKLFCL